MLTMQEKFDNEKKLARTALMSGLPGIREDITFAIRLVMPGDKYGLGLSLINDSDHSVVEFYDERFDHTPIGQFAYSYSLKTIIEHGDFNLCLDGGVPDWTVPASSMALIRAELSKIHH